MWSSDVGDKAPGVRLDVGVVSSVESAVAAEAGARNTLDVRGGVLPTQGINKQ